MISLTPTKGLLIGGPDSSDPDQYSFDTEYQFGARFAVDILNNDPDILPGYEIRAYHDLTRRTRSVLDEQQQAHGRFPVN